MTGILRKLLRVCNAKRSYRLIWKDLLLLISKVKKFLPKLTKHSPSEKTLCIIMLCTALICIWCLKKFIKR